MLSPGTAAAARAADDIKESRRELDIIGDGLGVGSAAAAAAAGDGDLLDEEVLGKAGGSTEGGRKRVPDRVEAMVDVEVRGDDRCSSLIKMGTAWRWRWETRRE